MAGKVQIEPANGRRSIWLKRILALLLGVLVFPVAELGLYALRIDPRPETKDYRLALSQKAPLFESFEREGISYRYPSPQWFGTMRYYDTDIKRPFAVPKPESNFRILVLGGSSAAGYPFGPRVAFSKWLELMLNAADKSRNYEVLNLGINGIASYEMEQFIPELIKAGPDLVIIYMGHNDCMKEKARSAAYAPVFFRRLDRALSSLRLYRLFSNCYRGLSSRRLKQEQLFYAGLRKKGMVPERGRFFYPLESRRKVRESFSSALDRILSQLGASGVPVLICTVESDVRDTAPEGSVHGRKLSPEELREWERLYSMGEAAYAAGGHEQALKYFEDAKKIDDQFALLRYRTGRSLLALGELGEGESELRAAIDLEDLPRRSQSFINQTIREKGKPGSVYVVDVEQEFQAANHGLPPGDEWFIDRMHPDLAGHQLIAGAILDAMAEHGLVRVDELSAGSARAAVKAYAGTIDPEFMYENYFYLATEEEYFGRVRKAVQLSRKALEWKPEDRLVKEMMLLRLQSKYGRVNTYE